MTARYNQPSPVRRYRTTDETGAYSFAVNPGSYSVNASGTCAAFSPSVSNLNNLKANVTANFTGTSCPPAPLTCARPSMR